MSVTVWLIILVPLAIFAWLVGQAMPTPRDRQLLRLRTRARARNLHVSLRRFPDPDPDPASRVTSAGQLRNAKLDLAAYALPLHLPPSVEQRHAPSWQVYCMRHHPDVQYGANMLPGWRFEQTGRLLHEAQLAELRALLARVPEGTAALETSPRDVTLCWRERGEVEEVDAMANLLADVADFQRAIAKDMARRERGARSEAYNSDAATGAALDAAETDVSKDRA